MAIIEKTGLKPAVSAGGTTIEFIEFDAAYNDSTILYITEYFNPVTGQFEDSKTTIYFSNALPLIINQDFTTTVSEISSS